MLFSKEKQKINHRSRKSVINNAGKYWGLIVKADRKCDLCQSRYKLEAHHIVRKSVYFHPGWLLLENGIALCWNCHYGGIHSTYYPDVQKMQERIVAWLLDKKSLSYDQLYYRCKGNKQKLSIIELEAIELSLKNYWKEIKP